MQDPKPSPRSRAASDPMAALPARVRGWTWLAWLLMVLEQTGRALALPVAVIAVFGILALFDVFTTLPLWLHWTVLGLFGAALVAALGYGLRSWRWPVRADAVRRLEADSGLVHRPLTHLTDRQASNLVDPWATVLWAHHQKRLMAGVGELNLARARSDLPRRDP